MAKELWIQEAIKRKGALRSYIKRKYGKHGFTRKGTIRREILEKEAKRKGKIGKRARLALTLRRLKR
jgi:hypothetical protein